MRYCFVQLGIVLIIIVTLMEKADRIVIYKDGHHFDVDQRWQEISHLKLLCEEIVHNSSEAILEIVSAKIIEEMHKGCAVEIIYARTNEITVKALSKRIRINRLMIGLDSRSHDRWILYGLDKYGSGPLLGTDIEKIEQLKKLVGIYIDKNK